MLFMMKLLPYFSRKSSTLKVFHFRNCRGSSYCALLSLQRFLYPEIGLFFSFLLQLHEGVGKKTCFGYCTLCPPPTALTSFPTTLPHSHPTPAMLASWLVLEHVRYSSASGPLHVLCPCLSTFFLHIDTWFAPSPSFWILLKCSLL